MLRCLPPTKATLRLPLDKEGWWGRSPVTHGKPMLLMSVSRRRRLKEKTSNLLRGPHTPLPLDTFTARLSMRRREVRGQGRGNPGGRRLFLCKTGAAHCDCSPVCV